MIVKIKGEEFILNENLRKCALFRYLEEKSDDKLDNNENVSNKVVELDDANKIIELDDSYYDVFEILYNDHKFVIAEMCEDLQNIEKITQMYQHLCYFGADEYLEILYKNVYGQLYKNEQDLLGKFFEKYHYLVRWEDICENTSLSKEFIMKYIKILNRDKLISSRIFDDQLIEKYIDDYTHWECLCENTNMSEAFFEKYIKKVNWEHLCRNTNISQAFFEKYIKKVRWEPLCTNTNISESFFERYIEKVDWQTLCENTNISEDFFEKYLDKVKWYHLCTNTNISEDFFERHIKKVRWEALCENTNLTEEFFERHLKKVKWYNLCENTNLTEEFFEKHLKKFTRDLDALHLCSNNNVSYEFIEKIIEIHNYVPVEYFDGECYTGDNLAVNNFAKYIKRRLNAIKMFPFDKQWKKYIEIKSVNR